MGVRRIFVRIYPNLPEKFVSQNLLTFFGSHTKKAFMCIMKKKVKIRRNSTVSLIHHTMRTKVSKHLCPNFAGFFSRFSGIFPGFLTNQNFWGVLVPSCIPASYTTVETGLEIKCRDSTTAIHGIKYR